MTVMIQIGEGRTIEPVEGHEPDVIVGYIETHPRADTGEPCRGWLNIDPLAEGSRWNVEQAEPLTLSPSVLCRACGNHGFIRNGRWVSA
jgi:hypothetical protein